MPQLTVDPSELTPSGATATVTTPYPGNGWAYGVSIPCSPAAPLSGPTDVSAELNGLTPFTAYHYRLAAARSDSEGLDSYGRELTFTPGPTSAPAVDDTSVSGRHRRPAPIFMPRSIRCQRPPLYLFDYGPEPAVRAADSCERLDRGRRNRPRGQHRSLRPHSGSRLSLPHGCDQPQRRHERPRSDLRNPGRTGDRAEHRDRRLGQWRDPEPDDQPRLPAPPPITSSTEPPATTARGTPQSASIGADNSPHQLSVDISGLAAATTYHYRVVASNEIGTASGPDADVHDHRPCRPGAAGTAPPEMQGGFCRFATATA